MDINKNLILCFFLSLIINISCIDSKKNIVKDRIEDQKITLKFPDSVLVDEKVKGYLNYSLALDTIRQEDISSRYLFLHLTTKSSKDLTLSEIKAMNHLTFEDTTNTGRFVFDVKFDSTGSRIFSGSVEDIIILKDTLPNNKVRIITKETNVTKSVVVKPNLYSSPARARL